MPLGPLVATQLTTPSAPDLSLWVAGQQVTGELARGSLRVRQATHGNSRGTLDARLNDPARLPVTEDTVELYLGLTRRYRGNVRATNAEAWTRPAGDYLFANFGAQDDGPDGVLPTAAPYDLSDTPDGVATRGYTGISRATRTTEGGSPLTTYTVTTRESGLWAGQNVELTSAVYGLSAVEFTIREVSVSWPQPNAPTYQLVLGDPLVRLHQVVTEPQLADGAITSTMISDGAVSTPKLAADAVVANLVNVAGHVTIGDGGVAITDGDLTVSNPAGTVIIDGSSNMFKIAATGTTTLTIAAGGLGTEVTVTLTALGALPTTPGHLSYVSPTNTAAGSQQGMRRLHATSLLYASQNSDGSGALERFVGINVHSYVYTVLNGSSQVVVGHIGWNATTGSLTHYGRYYVLKEAAL